MPKLFVDQPLPGMPAPRSRRRVHVFRLEVEYPPGSRSPGWQPMAWEPPDEWRSLVDESSPGFRWPRERLFLSATAARARAELLEGYGAAVTIKRSAPVAWAEGTG